MIRAVGPASSPRSAPLRDAALGFEEILAQKLVETMRASVPKSGLFHGGAGEDLFTGIQDQALARAILGRGFGVADAIVSRFA